MTPSSPDRFQDGGQGDFSQQALPVTLFDQPALGELAFQLSPVQPIVRPGLVVVLFRVHWVLSDEPDSEPAELGSEMNQRMICPQGGITPEDVGS
jgi:hypothetical protein